MIYLTEEMFSTGKPASQGEINIWMKKYAPKTVLNRIAALKMIREMKSVDGGLILGHSETGAHHVLEPVVADVPISRAAQALIDAANNSFVELKLYHECQLRHLRETDKHETYVFPPGDYICGHREEQGPEGWRRSAD